MAKATTMGPMKIKESGSYRVFKVFNAIILTLISVAMLYPFLYLVAQSFSSTQAIVAGEVGLIPKDFNISTYKYVITDGKFIPYYGNTIVYSIIGTVCALLFSALLAYPLSKAELYGGKAINKFIIFTMYFSGGMIPNYILMVSLGLRDTVASFILPGMISTYYVILMRSFFLTLPRELEEAGEIDGLDLWGVFWRIAIPLSKPIIATMTLFYVVQYWNDWFDAFLYLDTTTKWPVAYYLRQLISSASGTSADAGDAMQIASNIKSCAMVLTSAPIICIYPFIQKYFVQGMMLGGVKG
jgi:putative aldouronate transport system permease protein